MSRCYSDIDNWIERLSRCEHLLESEVRELCRLGREILSREPNVIHMSSPVTIVGDVHGQFFDVKEMFRVAGCAPETNYVFLGDYVDRGIYSLETFLWLLALKVRYPSRVTLLRGNHESRQITQIYGFYDECIRKYGSLSVWRYCTEVFDTLALACVVNQSVFCVHGGLSPNLTAIDDAARINRFREPPHDGAMSDFLWSDPDSERGWAASPRGAGYIFGANAVSEFLRTNNLGLVARAHQLAMQGFQFLFGGSLVTVWSAPCYCYRVQNVAAVMEVGRDNKSQFKVYDAAPASERGEGGRKPVLDYFL